MNVNCIVSVSLGGDITKGAEAEAEAGNGSEYGCEEGWSERDGGISITSRTGRGESGSDSLEGQVQGKVIRTKLEAEASTFQGTKPQTPIVTAMNCPRRMSMYFGASDTRSLAAEIEFAVL